MAHYAILDDSSKVIQVFVGRDENDTFEGQVVDWEDYYGAKRTSYNTHAGVHIAGGIPFRGNYAGIGDYYDIKLDAFVSPKPYDSWVLNETTYTWQAPLPYPDDNAQYLWDEDTTSWIKVEED